jgi:hypothetical protein
MEARTAMKSKRNLFGLGFLLLVCLLVVRLESQTVIPNNGPGGGSGSSSSGGGIATQIQTGASPPPGCPVGGIFYDPAASFVTGLSRIFLCDPLGVWFQTGVQAGPSGAITVSSTSPGLATVDITAGTFAALNAANTYTGGGLQDLGTSVIDLGRLPADPVTCAVGSIYFNTVSATFRGCGVVNVWSPLGGASSYAASTPVANCIDGIGTAQAVMARGWSNNNCRVVGDMEYGGVLGLASNTTGTIIWTVQIPITTTTITVSTWGITRNSLVTGTVSGRVSVACIVSGAAGGVTFGPWVGTNTPTSTAGVNDITFRLTAGAIPHSCTSSQLTAIRFSRTNPGGSGDAWMDFFQMSLVAQ